MVKIVFGETTFHMRQTSATGAWEMRQRIRETADARKEIILCIFSFRPLFPADSFFFSFPRSMHRLLARPVCFWQPNSRRCTTALGRRPNVINFKSGHCFPLHLARCIEPKGLSREQRTDHLAVCIRSNVRLHSKWYKAVRILLLRRYARFGRFVFLTFTAVIVDIY